VADCAESIQFTFLHISQTTNMSSLESFRQKFKGDIVTPSDADYDKAIARWAINAERKAKIVAFVKDTADVSSALKYAKANKLPVAVRGGGHSASGASSTEGGLVIDLSRHLGGVRVDAEKKLGYIGGGAIWETVDKAAIAHGLATVGGTVNHVSLYFQGSGSILTCVYIVDWRRRVSYLNSVVYRLTHIFC
jgi:hypothetical protein